MFGFACVVDVWACAICIGAPAPRAEAAASVVPASKMPRRLSMWPGIVFLPQNGLT
jgi:hypothetical protein